MANFSRRGADAGVADHRIGRDVAARDAKAFGQGPFDDVDAVHDAIPLGDTGAPGSVETDGMNLVKIGEGAEFRREIADAPDRGDIAIHRVERFKGNDLGAEVPCLR